jgi:hypothetical protein
MAKKVLPTLPKDAVGIALTFQTSTDLTNTTDLKLVMKVGSTVIEKDLDETNITNPGTGEVRYITVADDLGIIGKYKAQLIDITAGVYLPSEIVEFEVISNVE